MKASADIEAELDGYPEKKKDYPARSLAALRAAIDDYRSKRSAGAITDAMLERARNSAPRFPDDALPVNDISRAADALEFLRLVNRFG